ncbi:Aste57867_1622 [Aphanomyces stellatus]|uniref:Aste57867_1622 protein n=1 Tax=Aphanomyces stellatus TaxID=120398 RepID=A0A485K5I9_9STRA|nr:hypothetical protein As57867_001620 [Aphanomyces stellatus]VFT78835.1 Aste57867_1622 [Aphanomyces stellatus]
MEGGPRERKLPNSDREQLISAYDMAIEAGTNGPRGPADEVYYGFGVFMGIPVTKLKAMREEMQNRNNSSRFQPYSENGIENEGDASSKDGSKESSDAIVVAPPPTKIPKNAKTMKSKMESPAKGERDTRTTDAMKSSMDLLAQAAAPSASASPIVSRNTLPPANGLPKPTLHSGHNGGGQGTPTQIPSLGKFHGASSTLPPPPTMQPLPPQQQQPSATNMQTGYPGQQADASTGHSQQHPSMQPPPNGMPMHQVQPPSQYNPQQPPPQYQMMPPPPMHMQQYPGGMYVQYNMHGQPMGPPMGYGSEYAPQYGPPPPMQMYQMPPPQQQSTIPQQGQQGGSDNQQPPMNAPPGHQMAPPQQPPMQQQHPMPQGYGYPPQMQQHPGMYQQAPPQMGPPPMAGPAGWMSQGPPPPHMMTQQGYHPMYAQHPSGPPPQSQSNVPQDGGNSSLPPPTNMQPSAQGVPSTATPATATQASSTNNPQTHQQTEGGNTMGRLLPPPPGGHGPIIPSLNQFGSKQPQPSSQTPSMAQLSQPPQSSQQPHHQQQQQHPPQQGLPPVSYQQPAMQQQPQYMQQHAHMYHQHAYPAPPPQQYAHYYPPQQQYSYYGHAPPQGPPNGHLPPPGLPSMAPPGHHGGLPAAVHGPNTLPSVNDITKRSSMSFILD